MSGVSFISDGSEKKNQKQKSFGRKLIITEQRLYPHSAWYFICGISFHPIKFWKEDSHFTDKETESERISILISLTCFVKWQNEFHFQVDLSPKPMFFSQVQSASL